MKYYNNELDISNKDSKVDEKVLEELLQDVRKQINGSLALVKKPKRQWDYSYIQPLLATISNELQDE